MDWNTSQPVFGQSSFSYPYSFPVLSPSSGGAESYPAGYNMTAPVTQEASSSDMNLLSTSVSDALTLGPRSIPAGSQPPSWSGLPSCRSDNARDTTQSVAYTTSLVPWRGQSQGAYSESSSVEADRKFKEGSPAALSLGAIPQHSGQSGNIGKGDISMVSREAFPHLCSLHTEALDCNQALFYFGVLAIQALLLPRFQYHQWQSDAWSSKLTMYGHTIVKNSPFGTQQEAKAAACKQALNILRSQYPEWRLPCEPNEGFVTTGWNWVELLREYCVQNGLPTPKYTRYEARNGYRYEIQLQGNTFLGWCKHYDTDWDSRNNAAHMTLHALLVFGSGAQHSFPGTFTLRRSDESLLSRVPRIPEGVRSLTQPFNNMSWPASASGTQFQSKKTRKRKNSQQSNGGSNTNLPSVQNNARAGKKGRQNSQEPISGAPRVNANLLPLGNRRIQTVDVPVQVEGKRWKYTPGEIERQIEPLQLHGEKLKRVCNLLSLEQPEVRVENCEGRLIDNNKGYTAAAYFRHNPFLARAGAIGEVKNINCKTTAQEACTKAVIKFLLNMVEEDLALEKEEGRQKKVVDLWRKNAVNEHIRIGLLDADAEMIE